MKAIKKILTYMIILILLIGILINYEVNAENSEEELTETKSVAEMTDLLGEISWSNSDPINSEDFNSSPNYFCAEHGTAYAKPKNNTLGWHTTWNLDDLSYVKHEGGWVLSPNTTPGVYSTDYKQSGENPADTTYSNIKYLTTSQSYENGFAFVLATYKQETRTNYKEDPLQKAVWDHLGQLNGETNPLEAAEDQFDAYYTKVTKNPNVSCMPGDNVGTTLSGNNYVVGPFTMSAYVRAQDYTYTDPSGSTNLQAKFGTAADRQGTVIKAVAILNTGTEIEFPVPGPGEEFYINLPKSQVGSADELVKIKFTYQIINASGTGTLYTGYQIEIVWEQNTEWTGCTSYNCTTCKHTGIGWNDRSDAGKTHDFWCLGNGYCKNGYSDAVFYSVEPAGCKAEWYCGTTVHTHSNSCRWLSCTRTVHSHSNDCRWLSCTKTVHSHTGKSGACYSNGCGKTKHTHSIADCGWWLGWKCGKTEHTHTNDCKKLTCTKTEHSHTGKSGACYSNCSTPEHSHTGKSGACYSNCSTPEHTHNYSSCGREHTCDTYGLYCSHGYNAGKHVGQKCSGTTKCKHEHTTCKAFSWKVKSINQDHCQNALEAYGTLSNSTINKEITVNVPLTTNVSIYKYISKVEHADGTVTFNNTNRKNKTDKSTDTVKVEKGDKITFTIEIVNSSTKYKAWLKAKDTLPGSIEGEVIDSTIKNGDAWIVVDKNDTKTYTVTLKSTANTGTFTNTVEIITKNDTSDKMCYKDYAGHSWGPIVNLATRLSDSDSYTIKEYDVSVDKSIVEVKHTNGTSTYNAADRKNIDENTKKNSPVYAEYGDTVKYEINIYNTNSQYTADRTKSPYWDPDKVYVNIEDTLPGKYTNLDVKVSNNTGTITKENGKFKVTKIEVPKGGSTKVTVTLVVDERIKDKVETNTVKLTGDVLNINNKAIKNNSTKNTSSDCYKLNDYNVSINKYVSGYDGKVTTENKNKGFTNEANSITDRSGMSENDKKAKPVQVEKGETIEYTIKVSNNSTLATNTLSSGEKKATSIKPPEITETLQKGLKYIGIHADIYKANGTKKYESDKFLKTVFIDQERNTVTISTLGEVNGNKIVLDPGEYWVMKISVLVEENNMFLHNLENTVLMSKILNINDKVVVNDKYDENISNNKVSSDYVKMKDLVIAGKVWIDTDRDGYLNNSEKGLEGINVKLYQKDGSLVKTTKTDANGLYTFAKKEDGSWYNGTYSYNNGVTESEQRIPKATGKDENKNYTEDSKLIEYYVEYEYDGLTYKSTEVYSGKDNLNDNGSIKNDNYYIDSNAREFKATRDAYNSKHEIIAFNKAYDSQIANEVALEYTKNGHTSTLKTDHQRVMTARSFIAEPKDINSTEYLWLYKQGSDYKLPETEYLKYINLGLVEREDVDISITKDVYEVKTTVNGEEMTYEYNQNNSTLGNAAVDKAQQKDSEDKESAISVQYNSEHYIAGYRDDNSTLPLYEFRIFNSDYNYKVSKYSLDTVKEYKGTESELNIETTYRIKVKNNSITNDEPKLQNKDIKVYTGINEVVEYYDNDFVDFATNEDGTVKTFNVKTKDENGYLVNTPLKVVKAEYVLKDGTRKEAILSATSLYNEVRNLKDKEGNSLYSTLYIRPNDIKDVILAEGESIDILITFNIEKENVDNELNLILGDKINVSEISAYSTYYKNSDGAYYAAGLVDKDSNPGNFGEMYTLSADKNVDSQEYLALYEDDTFKSGITILLQALDKERTLNGFVWNDVKTNKAADENGDQYIGDGKYDTNANALAEPKKNQSVSNKEENDIAIKDMKAQLVEMIAMPEKDASGNIIGERVYEETIKVNGEESIVTARTNEEGRYELKGYIPGTYAVKFFYGDDANLENMLIFNGQDYKSTVYQATEAEYAENKSNPDEVLAILEKSNISDAKDDEIRRLEAISYSETMTNELNNILRGKDSSNKEALVKNTNMESETAEFLVRTEKELSGKTKLTYAETMQKFIDTVRHPIQNIDFGIEYRPELQVSLNKYISNVKVTTSDTNGENTAQALIDAKFEEYYGIVIRTDIASGATEFLTDGEGEIIRVGRYANKEEIERAVSEAGADISKCEKTDGGEYIVTLAGTELNIEKSVGLSNLQYVENVYDRDINGNLFLYDSNGYVKTTQGFVYLNIDDEIMQGASVSIEYVFAGNNISEVDRVSSNLSSLRFKENEEARRYRGEEGKYYDQAALQLGENTGYIDLNYSAAGTARNKLFSEYYRYELNEDGTIKKNAEGKEIKYRIKDKKVSEEEYYGRYLGSVYYTGVIGAKDVVAELKIDKILDYIDNDLVFDNSQNNGENRLWKTTTSQELYEGNLISKEAFKDVNGGKYLLDSNNRAYDTTERSNLAVLLDDRVRDYGEGEEDPTVNKDISKYISPRYSDGGNSFGTVRLVASKIISPEDISEDMNYENIGEIIQYSTVVGRVTTIGTTLGNANIAATSEWDEARKESDTGATEQITLTPPTGLGKVEQIVRNTVEGASYTVIGIIAVSIVCVSILGGIRLYRKRRIK